MSLRWRPLVAMGLAVALVSAACGGDESGGTEDAAEPTASAAAATEADQPETEGEPESGADDAPTVTDGDAGDDAPTVTDGDPDAAEAPEEAGDDAQPGGGEISGPVVAEDVIRFSTPDGEDLNATVFGEGEIGIVLAHMRGRDQSTWTDFARSAAAEGYQVLTFDFRGYGGSTGERDANLDVDLLAAVNTLADLGPTRIVVMGASMGATATVNLAARYDVAGVASLSAPANFQGLEAEGLASDVAEPLLVVVAEGDQPYADAAVAIDAGAPDSILEVFDGNAHGTNLFGEHEIALTGLLLDFVRTRVG